METFDFAKRQLEQLKKSNLLRELICIDSPQESSVRIGGKDKILFCSNNYLGLANHPRLIKAVVEAMNIYGHGAAASRLLSGTMRPHVKLEQDLAQVERDMAENHRGWKILLRKDLAEYPDIIIKEEKQRLIAERQSLLRAKMKIQSELESLPQVDPVEVEAALCELAKPWQSLRYPISHPEMWRPTNLNPHLWERASVREALETSQNDGYLRRVSKVITAIVPRKLTDEKAHLLRETLFKLNCRVTIKNKTIFINGKLPLRSVRANETAS